jgi:hypothetical protein
LEYGLGAPESQDGTLAFDPGLLFQDPPRNGVQRVCRGQGLVGKVKYDKMIINYIYIHIHIYIKLYV